MVVACAWLANGVAFTLLHVFVQELAKAGMVKRSIEIFDWIRGLEESNDLYWLADVFTYTTMIAQCGSHQYLRRALELVAEMRSRGVQCNVHTYSALMNVCIKVCVVVVLVCV